LTVFARRVRAKSHEGEDSAGATVGQGAKQCTPPRLLGNVVQQPERGDAVEALVGERRPRRLEHEIRAQQAHARNARERALRERQQGCARVDPAVQKGCAERSSEKAREAAVPAADIEDRPRGPLAQQRQKLPPAGPGSVASRREERG
jgi:hypothetical protein